DNGTYSNGVLQGPNAKGWVEIHHQGSELIEEGFSGTAVWSAEENAALGMTVSILNRQDTRVAYMIPASLLIKAFPEIKTFNILQTQVNNIDSNERDVVLNAIGVLHETIERFSDEFRVYSVNKIIKSFTEKIFNEDIDPEIRYWTAVGLSQIGGGNVKELFNEFYSKAHEQKTDAISHLAIEDALRIITEE
ncbi:MAG: hypothetical protein D3918_13295, partial [Candidatus Electrothrix sp. AX2]|nr:hypothetical protein [Candidatus Electrothrix gigas]